MDQYTWAIIGVCLAIGICVVGLIVFVILYCRVRIKEDTNIRKRVITKKAFAEDRVERQPIEEPEPQRVPIILPPPPQPLPPQPIIIERPVPIRVSPPPQPQPLPPPPPPEPRVLIREIHHRDSSPESDKRAGRRRNSWSGANDDWVLVKKIRKRRGRKQSKRDDSDSDSSSSSSSSDDETPVKNQQRPAMVPVRYGIPRLDPYDLAVPRRPAVVNMVPMQSQFGFPGLQPMAGMAAAPAVSQPGYVSVMMPQQM